MMYQDRAGRIGAASFRAEDHIKEFGVKLPSPPTPFGSYVEAVQTASSEITVKAHRGQVMQKMKATSFVHLVNMTLKLRIPGSSASSVAYA